MLLEYSQEWFHGILHQKLLSNNLDWLAFFFITSSSFVPWVSGIYNIYLLHIVGNAKKLRKSYHPIILTDKKMLKSLDAILQKLSDNLDYLFVAFSEDLIVGSTEHQCHFLYKLQVCF